jgi:hypothetical protein
MNTHINVTWSGMKINISSGEALVIPFQFYSGSVGNYTLYFTVNGHLHEIDVAVMSH